MTTAKNESFYWVTTRKLQFNGGFNLWWGDKNLPWRGEFPCGGISKFSASVGGLPPQTH